MHRRVDEPSQLEVTPEVIQEMLEQVTPWLQTYIKQLPQMTASDTTGANDLAASLCEPLPDRGTSLSGLLELIFSEATPPSYNTAGPSYLAYIPGGGLFASALADLIANTLNRYVGVWLAAPALVQLEVNVVRWFCEIIGYPIESGGFLTSGGSLANLTALITARTEMLPEDFLKGTLYTSSESHHSIKKAALLAGFPQRNIRVVQTNTRRAIDVEALRARITQDKRDELTPFLIVGNAGTTNSGAIDPLNELAEIACEHHLWFHIDAAYGGFFAMTERGKQRFSGIERADSITLDPHKGLFLPFGTGCLLVKDQQTLKRTHSADAEYMPAMQDNHKQVDFCEISPELSRDFRGLRVWLPLKLYGAEAFREYLDEKMDLACDLCSRLEQVDNVEIVTSPELSLFTFRAVLPQHQSIEQQNAFNRSWLQRTNDRQRVFLTGTMLAERFVIRVCVLNFRTHKDRMEQAYEDLCETLEALRREDLLST